MARTNPYNKYPKVGDRIRNYTRVDDGLRPDGEIIVVDRQGGDVIVSYFGSNVESVHTCYWWNGFMIHNHHWVIDGIRHHSNCPADHTDTGGGMDTFTIDSLLGKWDSSEGGEGIWLI
jgi:hypothetical protein